MAIQTSLSDLVSSSLRSMKKRGAEMLLAFSLNVTPVPASRPRVSRYGTYYTKTYTQFRDAAADAVAHPDAPASLDGPLEVLVETVVKPPKSGKYEYPKSSGDIDNFVKGPLDAMTKAEGLYWEDDSQIVALHAFKRYALPGEEPGFHIYWRPIDADPS